MDFEPDVEAMDEKECKKEIARITTLFNEVNFDMNNFYQGTQIVTALQINNLAQFLIKKGLIDEDELNMNFYKLMVSRFRDHEKSLPEIRQAKLAAETRIAMQEAQLLGPNGEKLM